MFYEEQVINGILCCRSTPNGEWREMNTTQLTQRILELRALLVQKAEAKTLGAGEEPQFTPRMVEAIWAAWHGAGVNLAGGNWKRFMSMLLPHKE